MSLKDFKKALPRTLFVSSTCFLICVAASLSNFSIAKAEAQTPTSPSTRRSDTIAMFECRGFGPTILNITLKRNKTYSVESSQARSVNSPQSLAGNRYVSFGFTKPT
jgi:hypothetical protein